MTTQENTRSALIRKLNPRALRTSPRMSACLAYALNEKWTTPTIASMIVLSDHHIIADGDYFGTWSDLYRNYAGALAAVDATPDERTYFFDQLRRRIISYAPLPEINAPAYHNIP